MTFITLNSYLKLNENLAVLTDKYTELVNITKELEALFGVDEFKQTKLIDAVKKVNELILDYKEIQDEIPTEIQDKIQDEIPTEIQDEIQDEIPTESPLPINLPSQAQNEIQLQKEIPAVI